MIVSLNEIEGLSYKAARGAGMSWGLAEEAAFATRWLAVRDANWGRSLIALLERHGDTAAPALRELEMSSSRAGVAMCPIHAGAAVADLLPFNNRMTLHDVLLPVWLLPFAERIARATLNVELTWSTGVCSVRADAPLPLSASELPERLEWLRIERRASNRTDSATRSAIPAGVPADPGDWAKLETWAHRTYVPASLKSRLAGAGAGLSDND